MSAECASTLSSSASSAVFSAWPSARSSFRRLRAISCRWTLELWWAVTSESKRARSCGSSAFCAVSVLICEPSQPAVHGAAATHLGLQGALAGGRRGELIAQGAQFVVRALRRFWHGWARHAVSTRGESTESTPERGGAQFAVSRLSTRGTAAETWSEAGDSVARRCSRRARRRPLSLLSRTPEPHLRGTLRCNGWQ